VQQPETAQRCGGKIMTTCDSAGPAWHHGQAAVQHSRFRAAPWRRRPSGCMGCLPLTAAVGRPSVSGGQRYVIGAGRWLSALIVDLQLQDVRRWGKNIPSQRRSMVLSTMHLVFFIIPSRL